jgi:hypothetical protein
MGSNNARAEPKIGLVYSYDPARYAVKVALQPDGNITGWLPLGAVWVGAGWGMYAPPALGEMCLVDFAEGNGEAGHATLRFFNDVDQALPVTSGEFWLVHKSGAFFKLLNTGALALSDGQGASITLNGDGSLSSTADNWDHTGPINISGVNGNLAVATGASGTFTTPTGNTVTVQDGIVTNIY